MFLGREAGNSATTLTGNTFIGYRAGTVTTNSYNTFVGFQTGLANTSGSANAFLGVQTGMGNTTGNSNTFLGSWVGQSNTTGSANTFVGNEAGTQNTTAGQNTFVGAYAGRNNTASQNTFIGHQSGLYNTAGTNSVVLGTGAAMGPSAGYILGTESTIIGYQAGASTATGSVGNFNTFIGGGSGLSNTTGTNNAFVGASSGRNNTTAGASTFVGALSGENNNGMANTFIGTFSGRDNTTGGQNVFIGSSAGRYNIIGASNTFIGHQAGSYIANGTTPLTAPTENILIGNSARGLTDTSSRFMNIGGAFYGTYDTDGVYAFGDNEAQLFVDGILGVGYSNPTCNSTYAGYIRYNSPNMEYCNGTAWTSLSGVSSGSTFLTGSGTNVINPVSPSAAGGLTIPANAISTTKPFEVVVFGNYSQTNVSTSRYIALSISYGATTSSGVDGGPVSATIAEGSFVYRATIRATTTTAATIAEELMVYNASGNVGFTRIKVQNYAIPSITSSNILYINVSMTPGHAGNIMKATAYHVEY
ncbi:MAG TPA: hypothetical protein DCM71_02825 [Runella sp.]|nr:hypothetical protein [Runella sp.]